MVTVWLGVFALLLQQYLSFGHVHVPDPSRAVTTELAVGKSLPAGEKRTPSGLPDQDCPICAAMQMSAAGLLPTPPLVAGPAEFSQLTHQVFIERFSFEVPRHLLFHTRAPPLA